MCKQVSSQSLVVQMAPKQARTKCVAPAIAASGADEVSTPPAKKHTTLSLVVQMPPPSKFGKALSKTVQSRFLGAQTDVCTIQQIQDPHPDSLSKTVQSNKWHPNMPVFALCKHDHFCCTPCKMHSDHFVVYCTFCCCEQPSKGLKKHCLFVGRAMEAQEPKDRMCKSKARRQKRSIRVNKRLQWLASFDQTIGVPTVVKDNVKQEVDSGEPVLPDLRCSKKAWDRQAMAYRSLLRLYKAVQPPCDMSI